VRLTPRCCADAECRAKPLATISVATEVIRVAFMWISLGVNMLWQLSCGDRT
jgi:hypothetical protein